MTSCVFTGNSKRLFYFLFIFILLGIILAILEGPRKILQERFIQSKGTIQEYIRVHRCPKVKYFIEVSR